MTASLASVKRLKKAQRFDEALALLDILLAREPDCPGWWNMRGDLLQLCSDSPDSPSLREAERAYKRALRLDPRNLDAIQSLAHWFDAVVSRPKQAKLFAARYLSSAREAQRLMQEILDSE